MTSPIPILAKLEALPKAKFNERRGVACCPAHPDAKPSLKWTIKPDLVLIRDFGGCTPEAIVDKLGATMADLFVPNESGRRKRQAPPPNHPRNSDANAQTSVDGPLLDLAKAKKLRPEALSERGVRQVRRYGAFACEIAYLDEDRNRQAVRYRVGREFWWRSGDHAMLYGLDRLATIREQGWVLLVEGESDVWTADEYGIPALGIPGKGNWRPEWRRHLDGIEVVLWQEPDAEDLTARIAADIPAARVIVAPADAKDISDAHVAGKDVAQLVAGLRALAPTAAEILAKQRAEEIAARMPEVMRRAGPILDAADPMSIVDEVIEARGFGGDRNMVGLVYLAATTRLLRYRRGALPAHVLLVGLPSSGKTFVADSALELLPSDAIHDMDAGSARTVIYEDSDLRHKVLKFPEADSIPAGEDNPAASALRALLTDGRLAYKVTVRDPETGKWTVQHIEKDGPTILISTAVRRLAPQFDSRVFVLEVADEIKQLRSALDAQATTEVDGLADVPLRDALVAYQEYLASRAPWDVVVPFAKGLATAIGKSAIAPRITRDFGRIISLIKAAAIVRHRHRDTDVSGRLVASIKDYDLVRLLVEDVFAGSTSGASKRIRETVEALSFALGEKGGANAEASVRDVHKHLSTVTYSAVWRRLQAAIQGWIRAQS